MTPKAKAMPFEIKAKVKKNVDMSCFCVDNISVEILFRPHSL